MPDGSKLVTNSALNTKIGEVENKTPEAVVRRCSVKKVFLEIWRYLQENTCARVCF